MKCVNLLSRHVLTTLLAVILTWTFFESQSLAQQNRPELVTRAYPLGDIVASANHYEFQGIDLPGVGGGGGVGFTSNRAFGGGGAPGASGGGGVFSVPDPQIYDAGIRGTAPQLGGMGLGAGGGSSAGSGFHMPDSIEVSPDEIIDTISSLVEMQDPEAWSFGDIQQLGTSMIVTASAENHQRITEHLQMIRDTVSKTRRSVTTTVTWLQVAREEFEQLAPETNNGLVTVDRDRLTAIAREYGSSGSITCFDGQTVHLVSGEIKNRIKSATPVVGSLTPTNSARSLATTAQSGTIRLISNQQEMAAGGGSPGILLPSTGGGSAEGIGYNPISESINLGAMLQLTPYTVPGEQAALMDIHSNVVIPVNMAPGTELIDFMDRLKLGRLHVRSQQFRTSLKLPMNQPVLVGGSTIQVGTDSSLYVILEVSAGQ